MGLVDKHERYNGKYYQGDVYKVKDRHGINHFYMIILKDRQHLIMLELSTGSSANMRLSSKIDGFDIMPNGTLGAYTEQQDLFWQNFAHSDYVWEYVDNITITPLGQLLENG